MQTTQVNHVFWIWFENREISDLTAATAPNFNSFATTYANFTNFFGVEHPSEPNYLDSVSGSNQGVTNDNHFTFPAATDNLAKQLAAAGKSWRLYAQDYPGGCSDVDTFAGGVDGDGVAGTYVRKHNHIISFESVRLDPTQCSFIQPLANFDPTVNFALVVPNLTNDMHDGTTAQGDTFLGAFLPKITGSADWAHTLVIITFDEGSTNLNGGGNIYTAAGAPWLSNKPVTPTYNHFSMLRTIEHIFGLPFLGSAATATTINEILPQITTADTVSGRVLSRDGRGLRNARVVMRDQAGNVQTILTNAFGYYGFESVVSEASYMVAVDARGSTFAQRAITANDSLTEIDFVAQ
ncbi:MAG TPA: alkaline phosphatase family protein [Pyrinomonadaceae bacterium]